MRARAYRLEPELKQQRPFACPQGTLSKKNGL
jgi:hypothetical protein